jgi:hypothetical protein
MHQELRLNSFMSYVVLPCTLPIRKALVTEDMISSSRAKPTSASAFGPAGVVSQRVNQMLRVPNLDGDAKRTRRFILVRIKEDPTSSGEGKYCISLHLSACVGVTSCERGNRSQGDN